MTLTPTTTRALPRLGALRASRLQFQPTITARSCQAPLTALSRKSSPNKTLCTNAQQQQPSRASPISQLSVANASRRSASTKTPSTSPAAQLDWDGFFNLRKTRRRFQLASSTLTTVVGGTGGASLVVNQNIEPLLGMVPLDPLISVGLLTMCCAGLGWLAGPSLGNTLFYMMKSGVKAPMNHKEAEFFARIKKNRVDPTTSSVQNPVPDFYGEKISSVKGYRSWLKDQRAFNKKRTMV